MEITELMGKQPLHYSPAFYSLPQAISPNLTTHLGPQVGWSGR